LVLKAKLFFSAFISTDHNFISRNDFFGVAGSPSRPRLNLGCSGTAYGDALQNKQTIINGMTKNVLPQYKKCHVMGI